MKICWFWCELKLLLADITRSVRLSEEVTRVSQHFGVLTIEFSRYLVELVALAIDRYDDVGVTYYLLLVVVALGWLLLISRRACARALKRRRLNKWKRCVLSFAFERSAVDSFAYVCKMASFGLVFSRPADSCFEARAVVC
ncbi:hypothetical protein F511_18252 [Dorcoceras hygrometricum]|uniref:Uncharacterized protein n=1 Tax=Dorcoceras hygrometricum TaxID=472368 RepID=A0A2Z7A7R0_9LAMI|nr:hypothetical protein F511_18252 [Dorcoceras hygrometricum]